MSQRILIVGVSESGKTSLANRLIENAPVPVYIRDPVGNDWTKCDGIFETSDELQILIQKHGSPCIAVIDEAIDFFGTHDRGNHWIFTRGRHQGILAIAIAHRIKMLAPNVRDNATDLYVFESSPEAAQILAEAYNMPELEESSTFETGEFFHVRKVDRKRVCTRHKLF